MHDDSREVVRSTCAEARKRFGCSVATLLAFTGTSHVTVEWRDPASSLLPPGRLFRTDELPGVGRSELRGDTSVPPVGSLSIEIDGHVRRALVLEWTPPALEPDAAALARLQHFADRAGLALEKVERRHAEAASKRSAEQTQRLLDLSSALSAALTMEEVIAAIREQGRHQAGADVVGVYLVEGDMVGLAASDASTGEPRLVVADEEPSAVADAVRLGELVLVESAQACERYPSLFADHRRKGLAASASVPLTAGDTVVGAVELSFFAPQQFDLAERQFLAAFGRQGGVALEHARLHALERSISLRLQRQLLPSRLPELPGLRSAAQYSPGTALMEAGGDWYDVFPLGPAHVALTVGDVVGKGVAAAGVMGRLRSALRALALAFDDPVDVVANLERFADTVDGADFATLCYADLDLATGVLRYLHVGHVPMLVVHADGSARFVQDGRRAPLCVQLPDHDAHGEMRLDPGTTILLYSDGLVEGPQRPLSDGLEELRQRAGALAALAPNELAPVLVEQMTGGIDAADDIVLLVLRFDGLPVGRPVSRSGEAPGTLG